MTFFKALEELNKSILKNFPTIVWNTIQMTKNN